MGTNQFEVYGNYGTLEVEVPTGRVLRYDWNSNDDGDGSEYADIVRFDIRAFEAAFRQRIIGGDHVCIMDLNFWSDTGEYFVCGLPEYDVNQPQPDFVRTSIAESVA